MVMIKANTFEIKAKLSEYLERAARGERIVICRHNKPVAELRPIADAPVTPRTIGPIPGRPTFDLPSSFFEPLADDELELWEGGAIAPSSAAVAPRVAERKASYQARRTARRRPRR
jgi:prevent-host-death family protein